MSNRNRPPARQEIVTVDADSEITLNAENRRVTALEAALMTLGDEPVDAASLIGMAAQIEAYLKDGTVPALSLDDRNWLGK
jgi:hypothetical protein